MDQLSVFDKEALNFFCSVAPYTFVTWTVGEMDQPMPKALDGHLSPSIYECVLLFIYIFLYAVPSFFSRRSLESSTNGVDQKNASRVLQRMNERRAHQKTKPFFAAALCHTGNSSTLGSEVLSATTTVAVTSPLLAGRVVTSLQSTWGRSQKS